MKEYSDVNYVKTSWTIAGNHFKRDTSSLSFTATPFVHLYFHFHFIKSLLPPPSSLRRIVPHSQYPIFVCRTICSFIPQTDQTHRHSQNSSNRYLHIYSLYSILTSRQAFFPSMRKYLPYKYCSSPIDHSTWKLESENWSGNYINAHRWPYPSYKGRLADQAST